MNTEKAQKTAENLVGLYGTSQAIYIVKSEIYVLEKKINYLEEIYQNLINLGTEVTEQQ